MDNRVVGLKRLLDILKARRRQGKRVVFTNGCFDILHAGHARYLSKARSFGDLLVVGLNSDSSVRLIKGETRPIVGQKDRAELLSALASVDYVVIFRGKTPLRLINAIRPDVLVKGADWAVKDISGAGAVLGNNGSVRRVRLKKGRSTTNIIKKVLSAHRGR
jgi:D-beta-D-heptose 7-phosphate kinase/D-beta-D-heptose 1-phosphate adenosyltransferase